MQTHSSELVRTTANTPPSDIFETPEALLAATHLALDKKVQLLAHWAIDLEAKLRASDENMAATQPEQAGETGDLLRRVKDAQHALQTGGY